MIIKKKKIAYISGTRADFGLMTPVLRAIQKSKRLRLQIYATGVHLMPEFGETAREVQKEFSGVKRIEAIFKNDNRTGLAEFMGEFFPRLVAVLEEDKPDFTLTLGDRAEMLGVATACLYLGIPTGQVQGGEKTFTVDEVARHAITKLSSLHFPATEESAQRIRKLGEEKWRINAVGAPALDMILNEKLLDKKTLFKQLGINLGKKIILLTQHPVSEQWQEAAGQIRETIAAVKTFNLNVVAIYPHADAGGRKIIEEINREKNNRRFHIFPSLAYKQFLALEREAAVWVGNSSGAMIESASFKIPVVNIGTRQLGRQHGDNVINTGYAKKEISAAISRSLYDIKYLRELAKIKNPWGDGKAGSRIVKILEKTTFDSNLLVKQITY